MHANLNGTNGAITTASFAGKTEKVEKKTAREKVPRRSLQYFAATTHKLLFPSSFFCGETREIKLTVYDEHVWRTLLLVSTDRIAHFAGIGLQAVGEVHPDDVKVTGRGDSVELPVCVARYNEKFNLGKGKRNLLCVVRHRNEKSFPPSERNQVR